MIKKINPNKNNNCNNFCCTKIENFSVTLGNNQILKDVNLHIHCGELTSIIGPNGAGKSTLLKALLGEIKHKGNLNFIGQNNNKFIEPIIGYVPQYLTFDKNSPISVLDLFVCCKTSIPAWLKPKKKIREEVLESLNRVKIPHLIDRRLGALSGGELQRVLLALALDPIPNILLLDEPVSGVDQNGLELFYEILMDIKNKYDLSIILVSHDLDLVYKYSDRVALVNGTIVCSGTPNQVFNNPATKRIFGFGFNTNGESSNTGGL
ncbi:MAG: metal ABC transporter ATP-binding protein [Clostridium sp.]|jgi:zinc transport system ATP-binding protein|nr:metal ABC transporter ATP-binding protein [Clostridium sp.]